MTLEGRTIELQTPIFVRLESSSTHREAQVIDTNEKMQAVKVLVMVGQKESKRGKSYWVHVSQLAWSKPQLSRNAA